MNRFVFVDPPNPPGFISFRHSHGGYGEFCRKSRLRVPTLDIFHCASMLAEDGIATGVVDCVLEEHTVEQGAAAIARHNPDWVAIRTGALSLPQDALFGQAVRRLTGARIALFGDAVSVAPDAALESGADAVAAGDAAPVFRELARRGDPAGIPGLRFATTNGFSGSLAKPDMDLESLPIPRWDLVDYRKYSFITAQTSWGCSFRCGYCSYPVTQGARQRFRSVESVVAEFTTLRERYGLRFVQLRDPEFTLDRRRTEKLCAALIQAGTPILWGCETRLDTLDEDLMTLMAQAGCMRVNFGVESLNPRALELMGRPNLGREFFLRKVAALKHRGFLTYALYVIGLPGETRRSTEDLIDFAIELGTDAASFSMATPFPGTRLAEMARGNGWITARDPLRLTSSVPSMRNADMTADEIEQFYREAKERWTRRKSTLTAQI